MSTRSWCHCKITEWNSYRYVPSWSRWKKSFSNSYQLLLSLHNMHQSLMMETDGILIGCWINKLGKFIWVGEEWTSGVMNHERWKGNAEGEMLRFMSCLLFRASFMCREETWIRLSFVSSFPLVCLRQNGEWGGRHRWMPMQPCIEPSSQFGFSPFA